MQKTASTTMVYYLQQLSKMNHFVHASLNHTFNIKLMDQVDLLWHYYTNPSRLYSTDQHMMFINAVEDHGLKNNERPNWINLVREPISRLISEYYYFKKEDDSRRKLLNLTSDELKLEVNL